MENLTFDLLTFEYLPTNAAQDLTIGNLISYIQADPDLIEQAADCDTLEKALITALAAQPLDPQHKHFQAFFQTPLSDWEAYVRVFDDGTYKVDLTSPRGGPAVRTLCAIRDLFTIEQWFEMDWITPQPLAA